MKIILCLILFIKIFTKALELQRIINGYDADIKEFPYIVSLKNNEQHFCGGTILSSSFILTAAQCICNDLDNLGNFSVQYSSTILSNSTKNTIKIERVICHPDFYLDFMVGFDLALLKLKHEILGEFWEPVDLATEEDLVENIYVKFKDLVLVGWGNTSNDKIPKRLQKIGIEIFKDEVCDEIYSYENFFCGTTKNSTSCYMADFGSPLVHKGVQIGILTVASNLFNDDELGLPLPIGFTRISAYELWIKNNSNYLS